MLWSPVRETGWKCDAAFEVAFAPEDIRCSFAVPGNHGDENVTERSWPEASLMKVQRSDVRKQPDAKRKVNPTKVRPRVFIFFVVMIIALGGRRNIDERED
jgi:hypothetical protein